MYKKLKKTEFYEEHKKQVFLLFYIYFSFIWILTTIIAKTVPVAPALNCYP